MFESFVLTDAFQRTLRKSVIRVAPELVISVKEARKLLGKSGKEISDSQIVELVQTLTSVADDFLQDLGSTNTIGFRNDS